MQVNGSAQTYNYPGNGTVDFNMKPASSKAECLGYTNNVLNGTISAPYQRVDSNISALPCRAMKYTLVDTSTQVYLKLRKRQ